MSHILLLDDLGKYGDFRGFLTENQITRKYRYIERYNLSKSMKLLHISNGYMQLIGVGCLMSNRSLEKWGFWKIKRANSSV
jgi:hypothetical protein